MKRTDYYRPSAASLGKKKRIRKKQSLSFFKPILLFIVFLALCYATYLLANKAYAAWSLSEAGKWTAEQAVISGADAQLAEQLQGLAQPKLNKPFSVQDAVALQAELVGRYPQLRSIRVKRGLLSKKLKIAVRPRVPIAKFQKDTLEKFIDEDGMIYTDPSPRQDLQVPSVELTGSIPQRLGEEYVELIQSVLKLRRQLNFTRVQFNLTDDTVKIYLPGNNEIDFGKAKQLRQKARRAAQIQARLPYQTPAEYVLDFTYFEAGKVFLRQKAH